MKKGSGTLLLLCALSLCLVVGIFIGRNLCGEYVQLAQNDSNEKSPVSEQVSDYRLDINTASKIQLMDLPGIGETIAQRIIDYRLDNGPFESVDALLRVDGIGEKKLLQIEEFIEVGG